MAVGYQGMIIDSPFGFADIQESNMFDPVFDLSNDMILQRYFDTAETAETRSKQRSSSQ